jgi:hypothetical protein
MEQMKRLVWMGIGAMSVASCGGAAVVGEGDMLTKGRPAAVKAAPFARHTDEAMLLELARALCPDSAAPATPDMAGAVATCGVCPAQTVGAASDVEDIGGELIAFRAALVGDLRGDGTRMALLDSEGCETHATNYGGHFVLIQEGGQWRQVRYTTGERVDGCEPVRIGGQPWMACEYHNMHMGMTFEIWSIARLNADSTLERLDGPMASCNDGGCPMPSEACVRATSKKIVDVTGDGVEELVWEGTATLSQLKAGEDEAALEQCPEREQVAYDVEERAIAQVYTLRAGALERVAPAQIKDAALRAKVEAAATIPMLNN